MQHKLDLKQNVQRMRPVPMHKVNPFSQAMSCCIVQADMGKLSDKLHTSTPTMSKKESKLLLTECMKSCEGRQTL